LQIKCIVKIEKTNNIDNKKAVGVPGRQIYQEAQICKKNVLIKIHGKE